MIMNTPNKLTHLIKTKQLPKNIFLFQESNTMHGPEKVSAVQLNCYLAQINTGGVNGPI
jgi:hypothetical protein